MTARLGYLALCAARSRAPLVPAAAIAFAAIGVYAYRPNEVGRTFGLTAVLGCGLAAWAAGAILAAEPTAQADMATVAMGGRRLGADALLAGALAVVVSTVLIAYPLLLGTAVNGVFERPVRAGDVVAAAVAHLGCGALGAAVGILFGPPRVARRPTAAAAVAAALVALAAVPAVGPLAVARALSDAAPGRVPAALLAAAVACLAGAAVLLLAATALGRRSG